MQPDRKELERRKLNILEALVLAALLGTGALVFSLRDNVIRLQAASEAREKATTDLLVAIRKELAELSTLRRDVDKHEVRLDGHDEAIRELKQTRGAR